MSLRTRATHTFFRGLQIREERLPVEARFAHLRRTLETVRMASELLQWTERRRTHVIQVDANGVAASLVTPKGASGSRRVILYLHGGAFVGGDPVQGFAYCNTLCGMVGAAALCPRYRYAPEHPYPAAIEDAVSSY